MQKYIQNSDKQMELFNRIQLLTILGKIFTMDTWLGFEYISVIC